MSLHTYQFITNLSVSLIYFKFIRFVLVYFLSFRPDLFNDVIIFLFVLGVVQEICLISWDPLLIMAKITCTMLLYWTAMHYQWSVTFTVGKIMREPTSCHVCNNVGIIGGLYQLLA